MPSRVSKHKKAAVCLAEKILVFDKLHSGLSYNAVDREFNVNKSTLYSMLNKVFLNRNTCKTRYVFIS